MRNIKTYYSILRKKGLYTCLREFKKIVWPIWWTHNREAIDLIQAERASRYLWGKYNRLIESPLPSYEQTEIIKTIWVCWFQGLNQAPEIVQRCVASIKLHMPEYEICILTAENIFDFVTLPEPIIRKYQSGTITHTHFSDILRTALLVQHGGIWLDATVLLTDAIPLQIAEQPLFMLQKSPLSSIPHFASSWFIVSRKGHPVMKRMLELLSEYWQKESVLIDYFLFHLFMYLLMSRNSQAKEFAMKMPYISSGDAHLLQFRLFDSFDAQQWEQICTRSAIHKLTWKFNHNEPLDKPGTFYDYILHHLHI